MNAPATNIAALRGSPPPKKGMADIIKLPKAKQLPAMLEAFQIEIKRALPSHLNADRISRIALTAFRRVPKLASCDPASVFAAIIQSAQLGLEIDTLGRAYLVPYEKNTKVDGRWNKSLECQFIPGWKGLVELVHRAGQASAWTGAVFQGDHFDYALGDSPYVKHRPSGESSPEKLTHVYAVGRPKGADWPIIEVWPVARVKQHRDRYNKVGEKHYSFGNMEMYARKVVLLQVLKYLPMSPELERAITMNDDAEVGKQHLSVNDAIDGEYEAVTSGIDDDQNGDNDDDGTGDTVEKNDPQPADNGGAAAQTEKQPEETVAKAAPGPKSTRTRANIE
jgi:recombination protein RecT